MFELYNEAVATLSVRPRDSRKIPNEIPTSLTRLTIQQIENFVRVTLVQTDVREDRSTCPFAKDFSRLADLLQNDSRVLLDFEGVDQFSAVSVGQLKVFCQQLKSKGSRLVLCNLTSTVRSSFYPARLPR
ncbi:STAS domain-containing protein [Roseiconus nitratireducens]